MQKQKTLSQVFLISLRLSFFSQPTTTLPKMQPKKRKSPITTKKKQKNKNNYEKKNKRNWKKKKCLGFIDARAMVGEDLLALGIEVGIGRRSVAAGGVAVGGRVVLRRVSHFPIPNPDLLS